MIRDILLANGFDLDESQFEFKELLIKSILSALTALIAPAITKLITPLTKMGELCDQTTQQWITTMIS